MAWRRSEGIVTERDRSDVHVIDFVVVADADDGIDLHSLEVIGSPPLNLTQSGRLNIAVHTSLRQHDHVP